MLYLLPIGENGKITWKKEEDMRTDEEFIAKLDNENKNGVSNFVSYYYTLPPKLLAKFILNCQYLTIDTELIIQLIDNAFDIGDAIKSFNMWLISAESDKLDMKRILTEINRKGEEVDENIKKEDNYEWGNEFIPKTFKLENFKEEDENKIIYN